MILVACGQPPPDFAMKVVRPAKTWVSKKGWDWTAPPPKGMSRKLPPYWTKALDHLHQFHGGICAYLSVYIHRSLDATSIDHYLPKSQSRVSSAYDWANYRLASRPKKTNKKEHMDVLDPFSLPPGLFTLNLLNGRVGIDVGVAPIDSTLHAQAVTTLQRLKLNDGEYRELRLGYIDDYLQQAHGQSPTTVLHARERLLMQSPFIHQEILRQGW